MADRIKFVTNAHVDAILRAMRAGGFLTSDASVEALRDVDQGMSDTEIDVVVNGLSYGANTSGALTAIGDVTAYVDSDALPAPPESKINFFRVLRWQDNTVGLSDPEHQMFECYWPLNSTDYIDFVLGPDTNVLYNDGIDGTYYTSRIYLGARRETASATQAYARIQAGATACEGSFEGMSLYSSTSWMDYKVNAWHRFYVGSDFRLQTGGDSRTNFAPLAPDMVGGYGYFDSQPGSWVGDFYRARVSGAAPPGNSEALVTQQTTKGWKIYDYSGDDNQWVNFKGTDPDYKFILVVNGDEGSGAARAPQNFYNAALTVLSADSPNHGCGAFVHMATAHSNVPVLNLRSYDEGTSANKYHFIECTQRDGSSWASTPRFYVDNIGNVRADGTYDSPANDVAEWIAVDEQYSHGTVLAIGGNQTFTKTTEAASTKVAGVVALKPGMAFGRGMQEGEPEGKRPMTVCGITPVNCTTAAGAIAPGDLLVSSTDGMAQKAGADPSPGTILGKSLGTLEQPGEETVTGEVSCFINLQ